MSNISFIIFTYNEEKRIEYVIRNFRNYGEVLLLDDGSTDKTREIAEKTGARLILRPHHIEEVVVENPKMYEFIKSHLRTDWLFWGFTDNLMPKILLEKLTEISQQDKIKYVLIPLYTYLWGYTKNFAHKGYSPRFFHKDYVSFDGRIHNVGNFLGKKDEILTLPSKEEYAIRHYSSYNLQKFIQSHWTYAEIEAKQRYQDGQKFQLWRMLGSMARYVLIFTKEGYKSGVLGLFAVLSYIFFRFMTFFRLYELEHNITLDGIEANYSKSKEELLKDF